MIENTYKIDLKIPTCLLGTIISILLLTITSCKKFVEIDTPKTELIRELVFTDDNTANAAMVGVYVYSNIAGNHFIDGSFSSDIAYVSGKSSDEIDADPSIEGIELFENELTPFNKRVNTIWDGAYVCIYRVNAILEGLSVSTNLSLKSQLEGEAKFLRAFNYFYLVNLFGDIPLVLSTDYRVNMGLSRTSSVQVYDQIIKDLKDAQNLLIADYSLMGGQRVRVNKYTATALLSRVYLYLNEYANAEAEASAIIQNTSLYDLVDLSQVFLRDNKEAIWQLAQPQSNINSQHGYTANIFSGNIRLTLSVLNAFEPNDQRFVQWVRNRGTYSHVWKYKIGLIGAGGPWTESTTNLRVAEQYLIRAEARAQQNNIAGAQSDIDKIRNRAGLPITTANTKDALLTAIEQEKRIEFISEYGHRWLDLKRLNKVTAVLAPIKPKWQPTDVLYPIPQTEIDKNRNLVQNAGY